MAQADDSAEDDGGQRLTPEDREHLPLLTRTRAASDQRPRLLLPLVLALVLLSVSSVSSKFLASRGAGGGPISNDVRSSAGASTGTFADTSAARTKDTGSNGSDDCTAGATFALQGVDLVAYFSLAEGDEPVLGSTDHVAAYGDYQFKFSSPRNHALFEESPSTYLPAWGGFCSWGIPWEERWSATTLGPPIDINQYLITSDGTLRFFRSERAKLMFLAGDVNNLVAKGNSRWTGWFGDDETAYPFDVSCFCTIDTC